MHRERRHHLGIHTVSDEKCEHAIWSHHPREFAHARDDGRALVGAVGRLCDDAVERVVVKRQRARIARERAWKARGGRERLDDARVDIAARDVEPARRERVRERAAPNEGIEHACAIGEPTHVRHETRKGT